DRGAARPDPGPDDRADLAVPAGADPRVSRATLPAMARPEGCVVAACPEEPAHRSTRGQGLVDRGPAGARAGGRGGSPDAAYPRLPGSRPLPRVRHRPDVHVRKLVV